MGARRREFVLHDFAKGDPRNARGRNRSLRRTMCLTVGSLLMAVLAIGGAPSPAAAQEKPVVYLTFDDGPSRQVTDRILGILRHHGAKATFFMLGNQLSANPDVGRRVVADGHAVANHTWSHPQLSRLRPDQIMEQFRSTSQIITETLGVVTTCYRPPYGATSQRVIDVATQAGLTNSGWRTGFRPHLADGRAGGWDVDTKDYLRNNLRTWNNLNSVNGGDVVLLHDIHSSTANILESWMNGNAARFEFRALPDCSGYVEPEMPPDASRWYRFQTARLYRAYFGRLPDESGARYWNGMVAERKVGLMQMSDLFATSDEFEARHGHQSDPEFVEFVYREVLERESDADGLDYWVTQLSSGLTRGGLIVYFAESDEFIARTEEFVTGGMGFDAAAERGFIPGPTWATK